MSDLFWEHDVVLDVKDLQVSCKSCVTKQSCEMFDDDREWECLCHQWKQNANKIVDYHVSKVLVRYSKIKEVVK
jgi:hypothetical protein